jgi:hypothetical protein
MTHFKKRLSLIVLASVLLVAYQNCGRSKSKYTVLNSFTNLITNAGFERGTIGFNQTAGPGSVEALPDAKHDGVLGLRLNRATVEPESLPSLDPKKVYMISFWARAVVLDPASAVEPYPFMQVDTGFVSVTTPGVYVPETVNKIKIRSTEWERYDYFVEPGELSGHYWRLFMALSASDDSNNVVDFDELALEEIQFEP